MRLRVWFLLLLWVAPTFAAAAPAAQPERPSAGLCKKRKKRRRKRRKRRRRPEPASTAPAEPASKDLDVSPAEAAALFDAEERAASEAEEASKEGPSRWSNAGALEPVASPVPVQAEFPERARPRPVGVETPGQGAGPLDELISARIAFSGYHMGSTGQSLVYDGRERVNESRVVQLLRARASLSYERIAGSDFSVRLDGEWRPKLSGDGRYDEGVLNAAYVAWGLTEVTRRGGPDFGVALGRLEVREAGNAIADGLALRWRPLLELSLGAFGGFTGNPYGYNWARTSDELFSTDWMRVGAFAGWRQAGLQASLSGVVTTAMVAPPASDETLDRIYLHADVAWQPMEDVSVFGTGFFDLLPSGQLVQNAELAAAWTPSDLSFRVGLGRFSTVLYALSTEYSFATDPLGNRYEADGPPIVDPNGQAIVPYDAVQLAAVYNQLRISAGARLLETLEAYLRLRARLRDTSMAVDAVQGLGTEAVPVADTVQFSELRLLPTLGARFSDPGLLDATLEATAIIDDQSQATAAFLLGVGRSWMGFRISASGRYLIGDIDAVDAGGALSYGLPRDLMPGLLLLRLSARYFREATNLYRLPVPDAQSAYVDDDDRVEIGAQESFLGFAGLEWRL